MSAKKTGKEALWLGALGVLGGSDIFEVRLPGKLTTGWRRATMDVLVLSSLASG